MIIISSIISFKYEGLDELCISQRYLTYIITLKDLYRIFAPVYLVPNDFHLIKEDFLEGIIIKSVILFLFAKPAMDMPIGILDVPKVNTRF